MTLNPLKNVAEEHVFNFRDGRKAHNLQDLQTAIKEMSLDEFNHHVDDFNNDFANWIEFVYKNSTIANDIRKVTTRKEIIEILSVELGKYAKAKENTLLDKADEEVVSDKKEEAERKTFTSEEPVFANETLESKKEIKEEIKKEVKEKPLEEKKKQFYEEPYRPTNPPQTIRTHTGEEVHTVSTHATHTFIVKEFIYGAIAGFIVGLLFMAILMSMGAFS